jgi:hypothetical protein
VRPRLRIAAVGVLFVAGGCDHGGTSDATRPSEAHAPSDVASVDLTSLLGVNPAACPLPELVEILQSSAFRYLLALVDLTPDYRPTCNADTPREP